MKFTGLITLQAISNGALAGQDLPTRIKLLNWGDNESTKGIIRVGPKTLSALVANQVAYGFDKVGLDYEHQSVPGHPNFKAPPREYAAYGVPEVVEGDGLYIKDIEWTPSGREKARNYIDLSPVVATEEGEVSFLHSFALCPQGSVKGLQFFSADFNIQKKQTPTMNPDLKKLLLTLFSVQDENATEDAILAAGKIFAEKIAKAEKDSGKEGAPDLTAMSASIHDLSQRMEANERAALLSDALRDGKLVPNSAKDLPLPKLKALIAELESGVVPVDRRTPVQVQAHSAGSVTALDISIADQLGLKPEDLR